MESLQTIISTCAPQAGLSSHIVPFASGSSLKERLSAHPVLMAPMAGVSDGVYRTMARAGGAGLAYSEMVSVAGIHYGGEKNLGACRAYFQLSPDIACSALWFKTRSV